MTDFFIPVQVEEMIALFEKAWYNKSNVKRRIEKDKTPFRAKEVICLLSVHGGAAQKRNVLFVLTA